MGVRSKLDIFFQRNPILDAIPYYMIKNKKDFESFPIKFFFLHNDPLPSNLLPQIDIPIF